MNVLHLHRDPVGIGDPVGIVIESDPVGIGVVSESDLSQDGEFVGVLKTLSLLSVAWSRVGTRD